MSTKLAAADLDHVLAQTSDLWNDVRGRRIFMTGGTGFVGCWLVEAFAAANRKYDLGARLVLLTRDPERFARRVPHLAEDLAIDLVTGDARDFKFPRGDFSYVVHAGTERYRPADANQPLSIFQDDLSATLRVLEFARLSGARRFLFTSSGAIYGQQPVDLLQLPESYSGGPDPLDVRSVYGQSKRASEFACRSYGHVFGFDSVIARLFAFVGPHLPLDEGFAVGNFLADILAGRSIRIQGDGTPFRSYLYAADLAIWLWTLLFRGAATGAYNVGSSEEISIRQLAETIVSTLAPSAEIQIAQSAAPGGLPSRYVPATDRAREDLGLRAFIDLRDSLCRTWCYLKSQSVDLVR